MFLVARFDGIIFFLLSGSCEFSIVYRMPGVNVGSLVCFLHVNICCIGYRNLRRVSLKEYGGYSLD